MKALEDKSRRALVLKACNIYENPARPGEIVAVDEITFANLSRKGLLGAEKDKAPLAEPVPIQQAEPVDEPEVENSTQQDQPEDSDKPRRRGRPRKE